MPMEHKEYKMEKDPNLGYFDLVSLNSWKENNWKCYDQLFRL